jgi:hypothetical protein
MNIPVTSSPYVKPPVNITNIEIRVLQLELFTNVRINVVLLSNTEYIDMVSYILTGTDYTNWNNDDNYIVDYVLNKLDFTRNPNLQISTS